MEVRFIDGPWDGRWREMPYNALPEILRVPLPSPPIVADPEQDTVRFFPYEDTFDYYLIRVRVGIEEGEIRALAYGPKNMTPVDVIRRLLHA